MRYGINSNMVPEFSKSGIWIEAKRTNVTTGRLIPIPWHIVARQYNVSISTNAFSPIHVATSSSLLGFLGTSSLSYAICRNEIATQQAQLQVLRELEQKAAELQADNKAKE